MRVSKSGRRCLGLAVSARGSSSMLANLQTNTLGQSQSSTIPTSTDCLPPPPPPPPTVVVVVVVVEGREVVERPGSGNSEAASTGRFDLAGLTKAGLSVSLPCTSTQGIRSINWNP